MKKTLLTNLGLALLRIVPSAIMIIVHGLPKLQDLTNGDFEFPDPLGIGGAPSLFLTVVGEVVAPFLVLIGYKTRIAAIPAAITMFVAAFVYHAGHGFDKQELGTLFLIFFVVIALVGPGKFSIDKK